MRTTVSADRVIIWATRQRIGKQHGDVLGRGQGERAGRADPHAALGTFKVGADPSRDLRVHRPQRRSDVERIGIGGSGRGDEFVERCVEPLSC